MDQADPATALAWEQARSTLDGLPHGMGLNIAHEAVDRHARTRGDQIAIRWLGKAGETVDLDYRALADITDRFASGLWTLGLYRPFGTATLLGRVPELYIAALGTLKGGGVFTPLFSAFGPDPVSMRLRLGRSDVLVTTAALYRRKVAPVRGDLVDLRHVLIVGEGAGDLDDPTARPFADLLDEAPPRFEIPPTRPADRALLHFTSGTTGRPKGAIHVHEAVVTHAATGRSVLDLGSDDVFWCTADPGWVTGTSYGIISPLVNGVTSIVDEADFDGERWYRTIEEQKVNVLYTAPTAIRMLKRLGPEVAAGYDLASLRLVASVGEPLDVESLRWAEEVFTVPVLDNWWQTETGGIMIANVLSEPVKPGSMGKPLPGVIAGLLRIDDEGELVRDSAEDPVEIDEAGEVGELALARGWPSMFRGYLDDEDRYHSCFAGRWYRSGDLARRDEDGYYWFVGRNDDVIKSAGHLIGPFEVESALIEHPAVVEAGVIGKPDPTVGAIVKAFVTLTAGQVASAELSRELLAHSRRRLGPAVAPREIEIVDHLPHTRSGKIMRRLLKARELGLDEGDTSTLEATS
jgi:acetyl-CoA synthetase